MVYISFVVIIVFCAIVRSSQLDKLTSEFEESFIEDIRVFLKEEQAILTKLIEFRNDVQEIHTKIAEDKAYREDPLNEFMIVKRIIMDWQLIVTIATVKKAAFFDKLNNRFLAAYEHPTFPTIKNLTNAVREIAEIQENHQEFSLTEYIEMVTEDMDLNFSASDCFVLAEILTYIGKDELGDFWKEACIMLEDRGLDPLMGIYDHRLLKETLHSLENHDPEQDEISYSQSKTEL